MQIFPDTRIFLSFGAFKITWYAVLILTGALLGYFLAQKTMKKWGYAHTILEDYLLPMLILGILGARLYYVIFQWSYYSKYPEEIFAIWNGGLAIHGGLLVGAVFSIFYFKKRKIDFLRMFDLIMPSVALAQAFGRWGNFMNQEAYGQVVSASFYTYFPSFIKNQMFIDGAYRMPTFLLESVSDFACFLFLYFVFRKHGYKRYGECGFMYMVWYGIARFIIEGMRTDSLMMGPLRVAQLISLLFVVVGIVGLLGKFHKPQKPVVLFDLDGTLVDTKQLIFETFIEVFRREKPEHTLTQDELYSFLGPTLEQSFERYFPSEDVQRIIDVYQEVNLAIHDQYIQPIEGVKETLDWMKQENYRMAVVSNKRHHVVQKGIDACHLGSYFELVLAKEELPEVKPSPSGLLLACDTLNVSYDQVVYVGDNPSDVRAAKNMAAYSVGFTPDAVQKERLEKEAPCVMLQTFDELKDVLRQDKSWSDLRIW